jgi:hypothetical protein
MSITFQPDTNSENAMSRTELEALLKEPSMRNYLDGIFNMVRNIVGYDTALDDLITDELEKGLINRDMLEKALQKHKQQMLRVIGSITDAHQLLAVYDRQQQEQQKSANLSNALVDISQKLANVFDAHINLTCTITDEIYAMTDLISFEIAITNFVEHVILVGEVPGSIDILLLDIGGNRARLTVVAHPGGDYTLPSLIEPEAAIKSSDFTGIFMDNFIKRLDGVVTYTNNPVSNPNEHRVEFEFAIEEKGKPKLMSSEPMFEFENYRFSPVAAKLSKYFTD